MRHFNNLPSLFSIFLTVKYSTQIQPQSTFKDKLTQIAYFSKNMLQAIFSSDDFSEELERQLNHGAYQQIAQKLDKHIQDIYEADEPEKNRWIWELIQNAKDAPNASGNLKIRIELHPNEMRFVHNADEFRLTDLISLVQQFSSKSSFTRDSTTTGKYGTGFITTLLISKVIEVTGILKYKVEDESRVKNFKILLDREYEDRDGDLVEKVASTIKALRDLGRQKGRPAEARKIGDMDTVFAYKNLDSQAWVYIQNGIQSFLKNCQYVMLFNPTIKQVEIKDMRDGFQKTIVIDKLEESIKKGIPVLSVSITKILEGEEKSKELKSIAYISVDASTTVALPINVKPDVDEIEILPIDKDQPRLFKEFPLIGTEKWGYNYVLTSREFYPNQKRTGLRLKLIPSRPDKQVVANRDKIRSCHNQVKIFFQKLVNAGFQRLQRLAISNPSLEGVDDTFLQDIFSDFRTYILDLRIVTTAEGNLKRINDFIYAEFSKKFNYSEAHMKEKLTIEGCLQLMTMFRFMCGEAIDAVCFENLYPILQQRRDQWKGLRRYGIQTYLNEMSKIGSRAMKKALGTDQLFIQRLNQIYQFLSNYYSDHVQQKSNQFYFQTSLRIILNQNGEFKNIEQLSEEENLPEICKYFAEKIGLSLGDELADPRIIKHLDITRKYNKKSFEKKIEEKLKLNDMNEALPERELKVLFNMVSIFTRDPLNAPIQSEQTGSQEYRKKLFSCLKKLRIFSLQKQEILDNYLDLEYGRFVIKLINSVVCQIEPSLSPQNNCTTSSLLRLLTTKDDSAAIQWLNQFNKLIRTCPRAKSIRSTLSIDNCFRYISKLRFIKHLLSNEEMQIYNIAVRYRNAQLRKGYYNSPTFPNIQNMIIHPSIDRNALGSELAAITFSDLFKDCVQEFMEREKSFAMKGFADQNQALKFIRYTTTLVQKEKQYIKSAKITAEETRVLNEKMNIFKPILEKRLEFVLNITNLTRKNKDFITDLALDPESLVSLETVIDQYGTVKNLVTSINNFDKLNKESADIKS